MYIRRTLVTTSALVLAAMVAMSARADEVDDSRPFFGKAQEGWFWYVDPPDEEDTKQPEQQPVAPPPPVAPAKTQAPPPITPSQPPPPPPPPFGSSKWLQENLGKFREQAIDAPTPENVRAYFMLQKLAMDKAQAFEEMAQRVVEGDPMLDEAGRRPLATFAANEMNEVAGKATDGELTEIAKTAGLWVFFRSDCPYCMKEAPLIEDVARLYKFNVLPISIDAKPLPGGLLANFQPDNGQANKLGVTQTPTIVLVRPPDGFVTISNGAVSLDELKHRILVGAVKAGWIDEKDFEKTRPVDTANTIATDFAGAPADPTDPDAIVNFLRSKVKEP